MKSNKYYICEKCGNIHEVVNDSGVNPVCCGQKMTVLEAGVVEASREKHIPVVTVDGARVRIDVGSVAHPMSAEHSILWVALETDRGSYRKYLDVGSSPVVEFALVGEKAVAAYAYCNLHGLWKKEI